MAYTGPVYQRHETDDRGEMYLRAGQDFGKSVGEGIKSFGDRLKELASNKEQAKALDAGLDAMKATRPDLVGMIEPLEDDFHGQNLKGKQQMFSTILAAGQRADQKDQQTNQNAKDWTRLGYEGQRVQHDVSPHTPTEQTLSNGADILVDDKTGRWEPVPEPPDKSGIEMHPLPGTDYTLGTFNGKPATGALPLLKAGKNTGGVNLQPLPGTDQALIIGPDGKPDFSHPYQKKKPTSFGGLLSTLMGNPEYEPYMPPLKPPRETEQLSQNQDGTALYRKAGKLYRWVPGKDKAGPGSLMDVPFPEEPSLFPTAPGAAPAAPPKAKPFWQQ